MLPIYSKKSDQVGPLRGNISLLPRTSAPVPGKAGNRNRCKSMANITNESDTLVPSHCTLPWIRKVITPSTVPMMIMGCRRIKRRLKKSFLPILPHRSS